MDWSWTKHANDIAQALGFLAAGCFFIYKGISGYLRVNLSIKVSCDRRPSNDGTDFLAVQAHLKKGPNGTIAMHDVSARIAYGDHSDEVRFDGVMRSSWQTERISNTNRAILDWKTSSAHSPLLKLVPDEEIELTALHKVPNNAVCQVQVGLIGQRLRSPVFAQWKCSAVSFPQEKHS